MILRSVLCVPFVGAVGSRIARGLPVLRGCFATFCWFSHRFSRRLMEVCGMLFVVMRGGFNLLAWCWNPPMVVVTVQGAPFSRIYD